VSRDFRGAHVHVDARDASIIVDFLESEPEFLVLLLPENSDLPPRVGQPQRDGQKTRVTFADVQPDSYLLTFHRVEPSASDAAEGDVTDPTPDSDLEELRRILREVCPTEWNIAGEAAIDVILQGHTEFADAPGANPLDTSAVLRVLVATTRLLKGLLDLRAKLAGLRLGGADEQTVADNRAKAIAALDTTAATALRATKRREAIARVFPRH
jgi:hypothetical protein